jgi:membrane-associated protease RseP (regulator of RpoE activity)
MLETSADTTAPETPTIEPILRPEARVVRADRSLAAMVLVVCTLGGMGIGFGFAMYLMRAQLAFAPTYATRVVQAPDRTTWLGVGIRSFSGRSGTLIVRVYGDTAAQAAGLRPGDVVTTFDGDEVEGADDLITAVRSRQPGEVVQLGLERNGQPLVISARLGMR